MRRNKYLLLLLLLTSAQICFSQTVKTEKKDEISPELRKEAVAFLRETSAEVGAMRTLENRIGFSSEMAGLMWFTDEKEARAMYQMVIGDFRQLIAQYDLQLNQTAADEGDENVSMFPFAPGRSSAARKMSRALAVRQQIASSLAEHDAQLALDFFSASGQAVTNEKIRKQIEQSDKYFESRLLAQIAEQDPDTALKYARRNLSKGFDYQMIDILRKVYEKDADKGAAFGEEIIQKFKSENFSGDKTYQAGALLEMGAENLEKLKGKTGKKPMFSEQSLRELADLMVKQMLHGGSDTGYGMRFISQIERFSPAGAMQLRQKLAVGKGTGEGSGIGSAIAVSVPPPPVPKGVEITSAADTQKQLMESVQSLGAKQLPKEEREKIIASARKTIAGLKDPNQKLLALGALAAQVSALGDRETAVQILDEARLLIAPQPKNYMEFMQNWMLASSYAQIDAPKAFPILEDAILRLNDTIGGAFKVAEFIDAEGEIIEDGEVQVGGFGGGITRELTRGLGASDSVIRSLARADFARTKDLTNKFDRAEVRILAKMLVLRSVFADKKAAEANQTLGADMLEP